MRMSSQMGHDAAEFRKREQIGALSRDVFLSEMCSRECFRRKGY
jgi:hypothetical protein